MTRRSLWLAVLLAGPAPVVASGCACDRPLFPRLRCLFACHPAYDAPTATPAYAPTYAPPVAGPAYASPVAHAPAYGQPGCVGCDAPPVAGHYAPGAMAGLPSTAELPPGAIPVGPPAAPLTGVPMSEPHAQLPTRVAPGGYATTGGIPPTLLPPPVAAPLR